MSDRRGSPTLRRTRTPRADTGERLAEATLAELRSEGYDRLTVRSVAARAELAAATAYTYFGSKDHLVADTFARQVHALPELENEAAGSVATRVEAALQPVGDLLAAEPELAAAALPALLAHDPDVERLRIEIGAWLRERLRGALGADASPVVLRSLELALVGALLEAGTRNLGYAGFAGAMAEVASLLVAGANG